MIELFSAIDAYEEVAEILFEKIIEAIFTNAKSYSIIHLIID